MIRPIQLAALVFAWLAPLCVAHALPAKTWVLAVGNNRGEASEVELRYAERDAAALADVFGRLSGVAPTRRHVLLGAEASEVRQSLQEVNARIAEETDAAGSALVVFYSGHADVEGLHLGPTDLPFEELEALVRDSPATLRLLIVDACRSGGASRVKGLTPTEPFEMTAVDRTLNEGLAIITSSAAGENSQESDRLGASFFSHHLLTAMRGAADVDGDARVTLSEAYQYAYVQTLRSTGRTLTVQHPTYRFDLKGKGEVVLADLGRESSRNARLRLGPSGVYMITETGGSGGVVAEVSPSRDQALVSLPPRRYLVQERRARVYRDYRVDLSGGGEVSLEDLPYESTSYDRLVRIRGGGGSSVHGLELLGGGRGEIIAGEGSTPQLLLGYGADLSWLSVGGRLRFSTSRHDGADGQSPRRHTQVAASILLQRFVDFEHFSLAAGVTAEVGWHRQSFSGQRRNDTRQTVSGRFGSIVAAERALWRGVSLRVEAGPTAQIIEVAEISQGVQVGTTIETPVTWWGAMGLRWRL